MNKLLLELNLIPSSSFSNNCRAFLTKAQWESIKRQVASKAWGLCEICGGVGSKHPVEIHEIWHFDDIKLIQKLVDMTALCPKCHAVKHFGLAQIQGRGDITLKHFMKINKLSEKEAKNHIEQAFVQWEQRSKNKWTLDISVLSQYGIDINKINQEHELKPK